MEYDAHAKAEDTYESGTVEFKDAFRTLKLQDGDSGVMAVRTLEGWAVSRLPCRGLLPAKLRTNRTNT